MEQLLINFEVDAARNCPSYKKGTRFSLQDNFLKISGNQNTCLVLARKVTEVLTSLMTTSGKNETIDTNRTYTCGGCSGLIKFSQRLSDTQGTFRIKSLLSQKKELLGQIEKCDLFLGLENTDLLELIIHAEQHKLAPSTILVKKGTKPKYVFLILSGTAMVIEQETRIAEIKAGQLFGEMSLFCNQKASATVVAKTDLDVLIIPNREFTNFMRVHESIMDSLVRQLIRRLEESNKSRVQDYSSCMRGTLSDLGPAELLQTFNMHQLTGILDLQLKHSPAKIAIKEGEIVSAQYSGLSDKEALYAVFQQNEGTFFFNAELPPEDQDAEEIGDFMMLMMEGIKQADEIRSNQSPKFTN